MRLRSRVRSDEGFTLIELMVTVLILGVLIAIGLPTYLGTRERAYDRRTQENIRIAFTAERAYFTDTVTYTEDPTAMTAIEAAMDYQTGATPAATDKVYLHYDPVANEVWVSALSETGSCFYLHEINGSGVNFATSAAPCGAADTQTYGSTW
jgi:type IV pilus assembly protein PilA